MRRIGVIYSGNESHYRTFHEPKFNQYIKKLIYHPDFLETDIDDLNVLIVPSQLNNKLLLASVSKIHSFAEKGGIVVAFGPQPWNWLPAQQWEERLTNFWWWLEKDASSGLVLQKSEHPLFNGYLTLADCTWHQHGVFWPPENADILVTTEDGGAVLYIDTDSTAGTWIITTLDPDFHFGSYFMPATERFLEGFFPYLAFGKIS
ncbi:hypothetical protein [Lysinibacillus sp. NPDC093216]|uniref:hypothetical protein n=1 Tax=Lysinibacillus sp. NPDC093216 TaxID=3390576 RepID=UPI003D025E45